MSTARRERHVDEQGREHRLNIGTDGTVQYCIYETSGGWDCAYGYSGGIFSVPFVWRFFWPLSKHIAHARHAAEREYRKARRIATTEVPADWAGERSRI